MSIKVTCPHCQGGCAIEKQYIGKKMQCPRCSKVFQAQAPNAAPARELPRPANVDEGPKVEKSERIRALRRRRQLSGLNTALLSIAGIAAVVAVGWYAKQQGLLDRINKTEQRDPDTVRASGLGPGFHILDNDYWIVFDDTSLRARPVVHPPAAKPDGDAPVGRRVESEGLTVNPMKRTGPWYIVNDMGGLVPSAVGVWVSPNKLGEGKEAFYLEPGSEVTVSHWVRNFGGFKVYRVLNEKKVPGPGSKIHEAGWILGLYLKDEEGRPIR